MSKYIAYELNLVVRNKAIQYLSKETVWTNDFDAAWLYGSVAAFMDAEHYNGQVYIRLPSGREIPVEQKDFEE